MIGEPNAGLPLYFQPLILLPTVNYSPQVFCKHKEFSDNLHHLKSLFTLRSSFPRTTLIFVLNVSADTNVSTFPGDEKLLGRLA